MKLPLLQYSLYIFDLDNTLYRETDYLYGAYREIARALVPAEQAAEVESFLCKEFAAHGRARLFNRMAQAFHLPEEVVPQCLRLLRTYRPATPLPVYEGALQLLQQLKQANKQMALLTNGHVEQQKNKLKHLNIQSATFFNPIVWADEIARKPSPAAIQKILEQTGTSPAHCLMIGDSPIDEQAAIAAGTDFVYAETLYNTR